MFGIGFMEIIIILLVILIFIKPKDLPCFFKRIGRLYQEVTGLNNDLKKEINEIKEEIDGGL